MISGIVIGTDGIPVDGNGVKLTASSYQPPQEIRKLFAQVQQDYLVNYMLQNRPFDEFDGISLLERARADQETFAAYVGIINEPVHKKWRWKGRKNTARNKIIGILAHMIAGMLYPYCVAYDEDDKEDEMTARVMRILIEDHLKKDGYETKFLFMVLSALVNPAVFVEVEYVEAMQRIKVRNPDGSYKVEEVVDELLTGIGLNIIPIDQCLLGDYYTFDIQQQPNISRIRRISYDQARAEYAGKFFDENGKDLFTYVQAGMTRFLAGTEGNQTLFDVEWTEADQNMVQILTQRYRSDDMEVTFVGGVFMGNQKDPYNSNPFTHRRLSMIGGRYVSVPIYPIAKSGFEPIDPNGRFAFYKSAAFKEFWDAASQDKAYQLAQDGMYLDVIKPTFLSGVAKADSTVMVPGATIAMPQGATMTPYQMSPNLAAALNIMRVNQDDMSESTQDKLQGGVAEKGVTATATARAEQNAKIIMGVFSVTISDLLKQVGDLVCDDIIAHTTVGELDATVPEALKMKYRKVKVRGKEGGKDITNVIEFSSDMMGEDMTKEQANKLEWKMFADAGGMEAKSRNFKVNPYKFARTQFAFYIDPDTIVSRAMGTDSIRKERAFNIMMDPRVMPFIDPEAVIDKFVLQEYSDGDPDQFKRKGTDSNDMINAAMGQDGGGANPQNGVGILPTAKPMVPAQ